jgi:hypothetical protein
MIERRAATAWWLRTGVTLPLTLMALAMLLASCEGASPESLLAGKACSPSGACLAGYTCSAAWLCVPDGSLSGSGGAEPGTGGSTQAAGGSAPSCSHASDCPGSDSACAARTCNDGQCGVWMAARRTACDEDGGRLCDGDGACVACTMHDDCGLGTCELELCVEPRCSDGALNGHETATDCGGPACGGCSNGENCQSGRDCHSSHCEGGSCSACVDENDCHDAATPSYCEDGVCAPKRIDGETCAGATECASGICSADGVCCDAACDGLCESCVVAGSEGTCSPQPATTDPDGDCPNAELCDGSGSCAGACGVDAPPPGVGSCPAECTSCSGENVCTIACSGDSCRDSILTCPAGYACNVLCTGSSVCDHTDIHCPADYACNVTCSGNSGCKDADLYCSQKGSCTVTCTGTLSSTCDNFDVHCSADDCTASCGAANNHPDLDCSESQDCACQGC